MIAIFLEELSLTDLVNMLIDREKHLAISQANNADNLLIEFNKDQLQKVQKAIVDKTGWRFVLGNNQLHLKE